MNFQQTKQMQEFLAACPAQTYENWWYKI